MIGLFNVAIPSALPEEDLQLFGYAFSHDLKVSLRPILGLSQYLVESAAGERGSEGYPARIKGSAEHLERQLDALANYARLCARDVALGPVELAQLWQALRCQHLELSGLADECVELSGDFPAAKADRATLQLIFSELLANALKFTRPRQLPRVSVRSHLRQGRVETIICDQGLGIPQDCLHLLGKPFQKFHDLPGIGMGLTFVRRALALNHGHLSCASVCGQGSSFVVSLEAA